MSTRRDRAVLRLAEAAIRLACRRLPDGREWRREWAAELPNVLHDPDGGWWITRAARTLAFAFDQFRSASALKGGVGRWVAQRSTVLAICVSACLVAPVAALLVRPIDFGNRRDARRARTTATFGLLAAPLIYLPLALSAGPILTTAVGVANLVVNTVVGATDLAREAAKRPVKT